MKKERRKLRRFDTLTDRTKSVDFDTWFAGEKKRRKFRRFDTLTDRTKPVDFDTWFVGEKKSGESSAVHTLTDEQSPLILILGLTNHNGCRYRPKYGTHEKAEQSAYLIFPVKQSAKVWLGVFCRARD